MRRIKGVTKKSHQDRAKEMVDRIVSKDIAWFIAQIMDFNEANRGRCEAQLSTTSWKSGIDISFKMDPQYRTYAVVTIPQLTLAITQRLMPSVHQNIRAGRNIHRVYLELDGRLNPAPRNHNDRRNHRQDGDIFAIHGNILGTILGLVGKGMHIRECYGQRESREEMDRALDEIFK